MAVHIREIHVQNLGPVPSFSMKPGIFNLIYGRNEQGKTHLVEFLIRSLFRNSRAWSLRSVKGNGKVYVTGLQEKSVEFFPESRKKIEDFWQESMPGLPPDFSKLLVVKGAEVELATAEVKTNKAFIKKYLSSQDLLDGIVNKISQTIQISVLQKGSISSQNKGEKKVRDELEARLRALDLLFGQIDKGYSGGRRRKLADEKEKLHSDLEQIEKARRYSAYLRFQQKEKLQEEKRKMNLDVLQKVKTHISLARRKAEEIRSKNEVHREAHDKSCHHAWLKQAEEEYANLLNRRSKFPRIFLLLVGLIFLVAGIVFTFLAIPLGVFVSLVIAFLLTLLHIFVLPRLTRQAIHSEELGRLQQDFKKRFQTELTDFSVLRVKLQNQEADFNKAELLQEQLTQDERDLDILKSEISDYFIALTGEQVKPSHWEETVLQMEKKTRELDEKIKEQEIALARLDVDVSDFITEKAEFDYSKDEHEKVKQAIERVTHEMEDENRKLDQLKQRICDLTNDLYTSAWEIVIENLRKKREEVSEDYRTISAEIIGKKLVYQEITELRKEEDSKISKGLQSDKILGHLSRFTGEAYRSLDLDGDELIVSSNTNTFVLSDLSTGAQEQVLLALRIGFAQKWLHQDSLFLILDDAFQYSDWQRRQWLMDAMVDLAKNEWQILYFTMDDHIRGLFEKKGKVFKDQLKIIDLA